MEAHFLRLARTWLRLTLVILLTTVLNSYTIKTIINIGKSQFETFMKERVIERKVSLFKPIKASKLSRFSCPAAKEKQHLCKRFLP